MKHKHLHSLLITATAHQEYSRQRKAKRLQCGYIYLLFSVMAGTLLAAPAVDAIAPAPEIVPQTTQTATDLVPTKAVAQPVAQAIPMQTSDARAFLAVRDAARSENVARLTQAVAALPKDDLLRPWADYWLLQKQLLMDDERGIADFLQANQGSYLANKLRGEWLMFLGKQGNWSRYRAEYSLLSQPDTAQTCYAGQANNTPNVVRPFWLTDTDLPAACLPLVNQLISLGELSTDDVWQRIRRLLSAGKVGAGKTAAAYLPTDEGFTRGSVEAVAADPARYLNRLLTATPNPPEGLTRRERELTLFALHGLGKKNVLAAAGYLHRVADTLPKADAQYAWGKLARLAAGQHLPEALAWYDLAKDAPMDEEQMAWHVRAALRATDWRRVDQVISNMPSAWAQRPEWIYWQARALQVLGKPEPANALFSRLAGQTNFYGQLAAEALNWTIRLPLQAAPPTSAENIVVEAKPELQRALALFQHGMRVEGVREWNWGLSGMSDRLLLAAAYLAHRQGVWDRAIYSADRTQETHNFSLRYLAPYFDQISPETTKQNIDVAWVYGLMRQESRFVTQANSVVGAQGLMQVMPATAQWVAKKINLTNFYPHQILEINTNVLLGVNYLRLVNESLDNSPVLASAAYNAGPGRAQRWRGTQPLEGAIYAETIPFSETRDYVKKVMSNTMYYHLLFNHTPQSLKARLGIVLPQDGSVTSAAKNLP